MISPSPLRMRRIAAGMTQAELATKAQISQQMLSKLEKGDRNMRPSQAETLAQILGCRPAEILPALALHPQPETENARELELLQGFRRLDNRDKAAVLGMIEMLGDPAHPKARTSAN